MKRFLWLCSLLLAAGAVSTAPAFSEDEAVGLDLLNRDGSDAQKVDLYLTKLQAGLRRRWHPSVNAPSSAKISFGIAKTGELSSVKLEQGSGNGQVDKSAMTAIQSTAPFSPSPQDGALQLLATFDTSGVPGLNASTPRSDAPNPAVTASGSNALQGYVDEAGEHVAYDPGIAKLAAQQNVPMHQPMQMQVQTDSRGTPTLPQWKLDAGYDALLGRFFVGFMAVDRPPISVVMVSQRIEAQWRGVQPYPCHIRLFELRDGSGGYYFICLENRFGPCGWLMPTPKTKPGAIRWSVYFAQGNNTR